MLHLESLSNEESQHMFIWRSMEIIPVMLLIWNNDFSELE